MMEMDRRMMDAWQAWMAEYGYMDGVEDEEYTADDIRMMAADYLDGCDEWEAAYDEDITADMIAWARA